MKTTGTTSAIQPIVFAHIRLKGSLIKDTWEHMVSVITANIGATLLSSSSALEQLSSEAYPDSQQQMGCVKQLCAVWCVTVWLLQGRKQTRSIFLWQKLPALGGFSVFRFLSIEIFERSKTQRKQVKEVVWLVQSQGTEHPQCTRESVAAGSSPSPQCYR